LETTEPFALSPALPGTSAERQVYRYLAEQVFDEQPPEVREFLLDSVLLEEITPQHCDAIFQRTDSRRLLETLLRRHLFVTEIKPGVLRYHPLFREFLQEHYRTIDPERYSRVALQVADLYATQGQWLLAFDHYVEAGNLSAAQRVIAAGGKQLYTSGRLETLEHWFARVPVEDLNAELLCLKARVLLDRGRHHEAQTLAQLAETRMQPGDEPMVMLLQAQLARIAGRYEYALDVAQRVLDLTEDLAQRSAALRTIAICHHRLAQTACAIDELQKALAIERQRGDLHAMAELQRDLGICHADIGLLEAAEAYYTQADSYWATIGNIGLRSMSLNSKGGVQHLVGRYQEAHATLITALQYARESSLPYYQAAVLSNLGDLYADLQLWDRASTAYNDARSIGGSAYLMSCLDISEIGLLIRQRQFEDAARALRQLPEATERRHPGAVLLLKAAIACGLGHYLQAARDVQQALEVLEQTRGLIDLARAYVLQAQIAAATRPADEAALVAPLEQATAIANQVGHDAFLVAETLGMRSVLRRAAGAGWPRADEWLQRHQDMRLAAQVLEQDDQRPVLVVRTFGRDQIMLNGQPVELGWQKARELLYYLLAHPDGAPIDTLREAIWPNLGAERSRDTLRSAIYQLRSVLPRDLIALHGRQIYQINRDVARIDYDVEHFLQSLDTYDGDSEGLSEALDLYRGLYLPSTDNEWCVALRTHFEQRYLQALHLAAEGFEGKHMYPDALAIYQRILALDNLDEAAHTGVMRSQIALGNRAAAINQYHTLRRILDDELGLEPGHASAVEQLYRELLAAS
jgi:DNA-binding SARP family transcriptional activator